MPNVTSVETCLLLFFAFWMGVQLPLTSYDTLGGMKCAQEIWCICETPTLYKHQQLLSDLDSIKKQATLVTIEIGSLGHYLPSCSKSLTRALPSIFEKSKTRDLFDSAARTAISALYVIFLARMNSHWMSDRRLLTWNVCLSKFYLRVATCLCHVFCMHYCKLLVLSVLLRPCQDHASSVCTLVCPRAILILVFTICPLGFFFTYIQWWQVGLPPGRCLKCACVLINKENIACPHDYGIIHDTT